MFGAVGDCIFWENRIMKRLIFWILLLALGQLTWAQVDPNQKLNYKPWIVVNKIDNKSGDMSGKLFALEDSSIVLINPARLSSSVYRKVPVGAIEYLKVQGKASLVPRFFVGAFLGVAASYAMSKALDQSSRSGPDVQTVTTGAFIGGALGMAVFQFRDFKLQINLNGRQDMYEANKPGMQKWVLK